jgi:hypothetical protein
MEQADSKGAAGPESDLPQVDARQAGDNARVTTGGTSGATTAGGTSA